MDDIVIICNNINPGWTFDKRRDKLIYMEDRDDREEDQRTFDLLRDIANTLDPDIQMEVDVPSRNQSGRLPVLDLGLYGPVRTSFYA